MAELSLGLLTLVGEPRGAHVHVSILGAGMRGQRPLCGTVVMRVDEWESLSKLLELGAEQDRQASELRMRIATIADEACGIAPVETADESLTRIEREFFVQSQQVAGLQQAVDDALGPHCSSCGNPVAEEWCHCGSSIKSHGAGDGHSPVPMGCTCGYAEPDWKALAISRGEYRWKQSKALKAMTDARDELGRIALRVVGDSQVLPSTDGDRIAELLAVGGK